MLHTQYIMLLPHGQTDALSAKAVAVVSAALGCRKKAAGILHRQWRLRTKRKGYDYNHYRASDVTSSYGGVVLPDSSMACILETNEEHFAGRRKTSRPSSESPIVRVVGAMRRRSADFLRKCCLSSQRKEQNS